MLGEFFFFIMENGAEMDLFLKMKFQYKLNEFYFLLKFAIY